LGFSGINISPREFQQIWLEYFEQGLLEKNGYIRKNVTNVIVIDDEERENKERIRKIIRIMKARAIFTVNPAQFFQQLLAMRGSERDYKSSTMYNLLGPI